MNNIKKNKILILLELLLLTTTASALSYDLTFSPTAKPNNYQNNWPTIDRYKKYKNYEFKNVVVFGDSLSDIGSFGRESKYLAGGFDNKLYIEYLTKYYTNKESAPAFNNKLYHFGGSNYAKIGSTARYNPKDPTRSSTEDQISAYLKDNNNYIDPQNIYIIWTSAMDINLAVTNNLLSTFFSYDFNKPDFTLNSAPQDIADQVQFLIDNGAKYTMLLNVPNAAVAPLNQVFYTDVADKLLQKIPVVKTFFTWFWQNERSWVDSYIRNPANRINIYGNKGEAYIIENGVRAINFQLPFLPKSIARAIYMSSYNIQKNVTRQFTYSLNQAVEKIKGPIVYVDIDGAYDNIINYPDLFGVDDLISPTCTLGYTSRRCDINNPNYHNDKIYLTSDWFHPSPEVEFAIYQYIVSIFDAPVYHTAIFNHQITLSNLSKDFLNIQLDNLRMNKNNEKDIVSFVGYSSSNSFKDNYYIKSKNNYNNSLNIGVASYLPNNLIIGSMLSLSFGKYKPYENYNYRYNSQLLSFFINKNFNDFWANLTFTVGRLKANNINRISPILKARLIEKSHTTGNTYSADLLTGYDFKVRENMIISPFFGLSFNHYKVKKLREDSEFSTAMHFSPKDLNYHYAKIGVKTNIAKDNLNLNLEASYNVLLNDRKSTVYGAVNATTSSFYRHSKKYRNYLDLNAGINKKIFKKSNLNMNIGYSTDFKDSNIGTINLGISTKF